MGFKGFVTKFSSALKRTFEFVQSGFRRGMKPRTIESALAETGFQPPPEEISAIAKTQALVEKVHQNLVEAPMSEVIGSDYAHWVDIDFSKQYTFVVKYNAYDPHTGQWVEKHASVQSNSAMTKERWLGKAEYAIRHAAGDSRASQFVITDYKMYGAAKFLV